MPRNRWTCKDERSIRHDSVKEASGDVTATGLKTPSDGVNLNIWANMIYYLSVINNTSRNLSRRRTLSNIHAQKTRVHCLWITLSKCLFKNIQLSCQWMLPPDDDLPFPSNKKKKKFQKLLQNCFLRQFLRHHFPRLEHGKLKSCHTSGRLLP